MLQRIPSDDRPLPRSLDHWRRSGFIDTESEVPAHEIDLASEVALIGDASRSTIRYLEEWAKTRTLDVDLAHLYYESLFTRYPVERAHWWKRGSAPGYVHLWNLPWGDRGGKSLAIIGELRRLVEGASYAVAARLEEDCGSYCPTDEELLAALDQLSSTAEEVYRLILELECEAFSQYEELPVGMAPLESFSEADASAAQVDEEAADDRDKPKVDFDVFTVRFRGQAVCLRNTKLFRLFVELNRQVGKYFSYNELMEPVWGDSLPETNTVQKTAGNLRRRLKAAGLRLHVEGKLNPGHYALLIR